MNRVSRRDFLRGCGAAVVLAAAAPRAEAFESSPDALRLERLELSIRRLPEQFAGYRIGFLTDLHFGPWLRHETISAAVQILLREAPDIILLGGDYIGIPNSTPGKHLPYAPNQSFSKYSDYLLPKVICDELGTLLAPLLAPDGVYGIFGNHDRWLAPVETKELLSTPRSRLLVNEPVSFTRGRARLTVLGLDDYWTGIPQFTIPAERSPYEARILLSHNPDLISYLAEKRGVDFDLALCGHTHGGQICYAEDRAFFYNVEDRRFAQGLYQDKRMAVYTSRGIGMVELPLRINCPPEITLLTLQPASGGELS